MTYNELRYKGGGAFAVPFPYPKLPDLKPLYSTVTCYLQTVLCMRRYTGKSRHRNLQRALTLHFTALLSISKELRGFFCEKRVRIKNTQWYWESFNENEWPFVLYTEFKIRRAWWSRDKGCKSSSTENWDSMFDWQFLRLHNDAIIVLMMEAVSTSETSVNFHETTRRNSPEDIHILILCEFLI
jgi:hypothetical protein